MRKTNKCKRFYLIFLILLSMPFVLLTGCEEGEEGTHILIFTDLSKKVIENVQETVGTKTLEESKEVRIDVHTPVLEKIFVEIASHSGDIIIAEKEMLPAIFDPEGLYPLEKIQEINDIKYREILAGRNEEGELHLYALPIPKQSQYFQDISSELVALVPKYTSRKDEAFKILSEIINNE